MRQNKNTENKGISIEWIDGFLLFLATMGLLNIVLALVWEEPAIFRMLPCWIILIALSLSQRHLENSKAVIIFGATLLCYGSHQLMYLKFANLAVSSKIIVSMFLVYIPLISFMVLLTSTKSDNLKSQRDQLQAVNTRLRAEANDLLNRLNEMRNKSTMPELDEDSGDEAVKEKRAAFTYYAKSCEGIMRIRFKRDVANLVEEIFSKELEVEKGIIFEAPEGRTGDYKIRNIWGLGPMDKARDLVAPFRNGDMTRFVSDRKQPMSSDDLRREPGVYEDFDRFAKELFIPSWVFPIFHQDATLFIIYAGKQKSAVNLKFTSQLVEPLLSCSSQAIVKLSNKETRPSFSTFNT